MGNGSTLFSAVKPFLPWVGFFIGIALLAQGLWPEYAPCIAGYSANGAPIFASCVTPSTISLLVVRFVIATASVVVMRSAYLKRSATQDGKA